MLRSVNSAILSSYTGYEVFLAVSGKDLDKAIAYIGENFFVLSRNRVFADSLHSLMNKGLRVANVLDLEMSSRFIVFAPSVRTLQTTGQKKEQEDGDIVLGRSLVDGVFPGNNIAIWSSTLNLGTIITGLPGTGKTLEAMSIAEQALSSGSMFVVISPTEEWNKFGYIHGLEVVSLYKSGLPINFFKCDSQINIERFYENLATLLSIASNAGPYTRSLEKVLLSAFKKVYDKTRNPDPTDVYEAIEEEIIEKHAKKNNVGVEYTKHGENIRASLQSLRLMLMRSEFAYAIGIDFSELVKKGVVFDLSNVSNNMKPFYYALILNQIYSIADSFDINGDDKLRLLIFLEEAQLVLRNDEYTAATADLMQRIQDFRKKGVGIVLLAHSITEISQSIRRLCQTKLYFRQSSDVARYAAEELIFKNMPKDRLVDLLKTLGQRVCAVNYVEISGEGKCAAESLLIKTKEVKFPELKEAAQSQPLPVSLQKAKTIVHVLKNGRPFEAHASIFYIGEKVFDGICRNGEIELESALKGKKYRLFVFGEKKKDTLVFDITGGELNEIEINSKEHKESKSASEEEEPKA